MTINKIIILLVGNIASGKTTSCKDYSRNLNARVVSKDDIRYSLGAGEYVFDLKCEKGVHASALVLTEELMKSEQNIIIDETNMDKKIRKPYLKLAKKYGYTPYATVFPRISQKKAVQRRLNNNHGTTDKKTWDGVFKRNKKRYQEPTNKEGFRYIVNLKKHRLLGKVD